MLAWWQRNGCSKFEVPTMDVAHTMASLVHRDNFLSLRWKTLQRRIEGRNRIFETEWVRRQHPTNGIEAEFVVLHTPMWVNIIPLTRADTVVMVRQYRHGVDSVTLEFPGGVVAKGETPAVAAMRECREETGYGSAEERLELVGEQLPNPAFMSTRCYTYVWRDCTRQTDPRWDEHEVIETVEIPFADVDRLIARGEIQHSIIIAAWTLFRLRIASVEQSVGGYHG